MTREVMQYASIGDFYSDRGGEFSGEKDYGVWHFDDRGIFGPSLGNAVQGDTEDGGGEEVVTVKASTNNRIRVAVVDETGDVYALQSGIGEERVVLLGNLGIKDPHGRKRSGSLDRGPVYELADKVFEGWATSEGGAGHGISWFVERLEKMHRD